MLGVIDGSVKDLRKPDGEYGAEGVIGNLLTLYRTYNNLRNTDFKNAVGISLKYLAWFEPDTFPTASLHATARPNAIFDNASLNLHHFLHSKNYKRVRFNTEELLGKI